MTKSNRNKNHLRRRIPFAALLTFGMAPFDAVPAFAGKSGVVIRNSATNVFLIIAFDPLSAACNCETSPLLWAIAMPCDHFVCDQPAPTLTFSDNPSVELPVTNYVPNSYELASIRNMLLDRGVLDYPDNPSQQCVAVFQQHCSMADPCPNVLPGVEAILSFQACKNEECPIPSVAGSSSCPRRIDPDDFINDIGLGGLITLVNDLQNGRLDYPIVFRLPPPASVPSFSRLGLIALALILAVGIAVKFRRRGASAKESAA